MPRPRATKTSLARETIVTLTLDDGTQGQGFARAALGAHGLRATFFVNSARLGTPGYLSWDEVLQLARDGHEIGGHTLDHVDLTKLSPAEMRRQVEDDRAALVARGLEVDSFAYPFGARDDVVKAVVRDCGYRSGRKAWGLRGPACAGCPHAESIPPADAYATRAADNPTAATSLPELQRQVLAAESHGGGWVQIVFHELGEGDGFSTSPALFSALVDWLAAREARGTLVRSVREVIGAASPRRDQH